MAKPNRCGKTLPCSHLCQENAGIAHTCACALKWSVDPGCGHIVRGVCTRSLSEVINNECRAQCGQVMECGHTCKKDCAVPCVCHICEVENQSDQERCKVVAAGIEEGSPSQQAAKKRAKNFSPPPQQGQSSASKILPTSETPPGIGAGMEEASSSIQTPVKKKKGGKHFPPPPPQIQPRMNLPTCGTQTQPVLKLKWPNQYPVQTQAMEPSSFFEFRLHRAEDEARTRETSPKPSTSRAAAAGNASGNADMWNNIQQPATQSVETLPDHQREQAKYMLPASAPENTIVIFNQCEKKHLFPEDENFCHICRRPAHGPTITFIKKRANESESSPVQDPTLDEILDDDMAWRLGLAKCSKGHYYESDAPRCHICGEPSMFYLPETD